MKNNHIWRGLVCGSIVSLMVNFSLVLFLFCENFDSLLPLPFVAILVSLFMIFDNWEKFFKAIGFAFCGFIAIEIIIIRTGILMYFYQMKYSGATEMSLGFGVVAVIHHFVCFIFFVIGAIIACILTAIKKAKQRSLISK